MEQKIIELLEKWRQEEGHGSGAKEALCIRVLGGTRRRYASVGDVIVVSIKSVIPVSYTHLSFYYH